MKTVRSLLMPTLLLLCFSLRAQVDIKDTIFVLKDSSHSIFIDNNTNSKFYDNLIRFGSLGTDDYGYKGTTDYLKEHHLKLHKQSPAIPWTKWVVLKQYKGKFYAYYPSDFLFHFGQSVNDSTFIDWTGEGPVANKIIEQHKIDNNTYEFNLTGIYDQNRKLIIHIIDHKKGIAVFEAIRVGNEHDYYLMIAAGKIKTVPLIVNYCSVQKEMELNFDTPDYRKLLTKK